MLGSMRLRSKLCLLPLVAALGLANPLGAQLIPIGSEFSVSPAAVDPQSEPTIARQADGSFLVAWRDESLGNGEHRVLGRLFSPEAEPLGPTFEIAPPAGPSPQALRAAFERDGGFLVVWRAFSGWPDADVMARSFDPQGQPFGAPFLVHELADGLQGYDTSVAADPAGGYLVTWDGQGGTSEWGVWGSDFDATGVAVGPSFGIVPGLGGDLAPTGPGEFLTSFTSYGTIGEADRLYALRIDIAGVPLATPFRVDSGAGYGTYGSRLSTDDQGRFAVVWNEEWFHSRDLRSRSFEADGTPTGPEFVLSESGDYAQVAHASEGRYVVTWNDGGTRPVARVLDARGEPIGGEVQLAGPDLRRYVGGLAIDGRDDALVVWESRGISGGPSEIRARRFFVAGLFFDGFESGDTSRWSAVTPSEAEARKSRIGW